MLSSIAQVFLPLNIYRLLAAPCHESEIHAETSSQVNKHFTARLWQLLYDSTFIYSGLLTRTLLHRKVGRIDDTFDGRPRRQFLAGRLPALYLIQRPRQVHITVPMSASAPWSMAAMAIWASRAGASSSMSMGLGILALCLVG